MNQSQISFGFSSFHRERLQQIRFYACMKGGVSHSKLFEVHKEAKVQGQVQYKKKYEYRPEMCSDCYEEDHLRGNIYIM